MFEPIDRVMKMRQGGSAVPRRTDIAGQDHMLSYITPQEAGILQLLGGSGEPGPAGIPAFPPNEKGSSGKDKPGGGFEGGGGGGGGKSTTDSSGITAADLADDENYDQSLQQDIAMGNFAMGGGDDSGFQYGNNYIGGGQYTGPRDSYANAMSGLAGLRDFYSGDVFGTDGTGRGLGRGAYNATMGITNRNPYGYKGMFSRRLGLDPRSVDYSNTMSEESRRAIAANQFSKYANPQNIRGRLGFNPDFPDASIETPGKLRPGLQSRLFPTSYETAYGPTTTYNVERTPMDSLALASMPLGLGILADQLSNKTAGFAPSELFDTTSQRLGALSGGQATPGFRPANATETGDYSALGSFGQGIGQGIGALEDVIGGAFTAGGNFFNSLNPEQRATAQPDLAATDSVFGNFISGVQNKIEGIPAGIAAGVNQVKRGIGSIFQAPDPAPDPVGSVPEIDLAGFESRFAPAIAPETQQELDAFGMGLPGVQAALAQGGTSGAQGPPQLVDRSTSPLNMDITLDYPGAELDRTIKGSFTGTPAPTLDQARERALRAAFSPFEQQSSLDPDRVMDALTGGSGFGVATASPAFETAGVFDDFGMALKSLGGDFVEIPGGYMDKKTGKTYSGTPGGSARTFTGTKKKSVQPFSGESFIQNIGSIFGS